MCVVGVYSNQIDNVALLQSQIVNTDYHPRLRADFGCTLIVVQLTRSGRSVQAFCAVAQISSLGASLLFCCAVFTFRDTVAQIIGVRLVNW